MFKRLRMYLINLLAQKDIIVCIGVEFDNKKGIIIHNEGKEAIVRDCMFVNVERWYK